MSQPPPGGQDPYQPLPEDGFNPYAQPAPGSPPGPPPSSDSTPPVPPPSGPTPPVPPPSGSTPPSPYQAPYGQPFPQQPVGQGNNGLAIASMSTGIASIILCICCALIPVLAGGTAVALGLVSLKQIKERGQAGRGMAIAGIATGAAGVVIGLIWLVISGFRIANGDFFDNDWRP